MSLITPITDAERRVLALLAEGPAERVHKTRRMGDYTWRHEGAEKPVTVALHKLFIRGFAEVPDNDNDTAQITPEGLTALHTRKTRGANLRVRNNLINARARNRSRFGDRLAI